MEFGNFDFKEQSRPVSVASETSFFSLLTFCTDHNEWPSQQFVFFSSSSVYVYWIEMTEKRVNLSLVSPGLYYISIYLKLRRYCDSQRKTSIVSTFRDRGVKIVSWRNPYRVTCKDRRVLVEENTIDLCELGPLKFKNRPAFIVAVSDRDDRSKLRDRKKKIV